MDLCWCKQTYGTSKLSIRRIFNPGSIEFQCASKYPPCIKLLLERCNQNYNIISSLEQQFSKGRTMFILMWQFQATCVKGSYSQQSSLYHQTFMHVMQPISLLSLFNLMLNPHLPILRFTTSTEQHFWLQHQKNYNLLSTNLALQFIACTLSWDFLCCVHKHSLLEFLQNM